MSNVTISSFYCTQCGSKGIPLPRKISRTKEPGHLKKLYCLKCGKETNHAECRGFGQYDYAQFLIEYNYGNFTKEGLRKEPWKQFIAEWR